MTDPLLSAGLIRSSRTASNRFDAQGDASTALDLRARAARWWNDELQHHIVPAAQAGFRANLLYAGLFD